MDFKTLNLLFRCNKEFSHRKIRLHDLSDTEYMICSFIYSHEGCSQDDVATALKIDKTTVGKALTVLERESCVQRTQDRADRRKKQIRLTENGCARISGLINVHNEWLTEIMKCLSAEEQRHFENYCARLLEAAESLSGEINHQSEEVYTIEQEA